MPISANFCCHEKSNDLKVVSSENKGGSKIVPISPGIGLDCGAGHYLKIFISPSSRIEHISVSGQYSKINRRVL